MKKILSLFAAVCCAAVMMATDYPIKICGVQVTDKNASDLSVIAGVKGPASYNPTNNTLTLGAGAAIQKYGANEFPVDMYAAGQNVIQVNGSAKISNLVTQNSIAVRMTNKSGKLVFKGTQQLQVEGRIYSAADLQLISANVYVSSENESTDALNYAVWANGTMLLDNTTLEIQSGNNMKTMYYTKLEQKNTCMRQPMFAILDGVHIHQYMYNEKTGTFTNEQPTYAYFVPGTPWTVPTLDMIDSLSVNFQWVSDLNCKDLKTNNMPDVQGSVSYNPNSAELTFGTASAEVRAIHYFGKRPLTIRGCGKVATIANGDGFYAPMAGVQLSNINLVADASIRCKSLYIAPTAGLQLVGGGNPVLDCKKVTLEGCNLYMGKSNGNEKNQLTNCSNWELNNVKVDASHLIAKDATTGLFVTKDGKDPSTIQFSPDTKSPVIPTYDSSKGYCGYYITAQSDDPSHGTVTGGGFTKENETASITVSPKSGYEFAGWSDGYKSANRSIKAVRDTTVTATFINKSAVFDIWVDGTRVTRENYTNVTGEGINGQVMYDLSRNILMVTGSLTRGDAYTGIEIGRSDLTVILNGVTIKTNNAPAIQIKDNVKGVKIIFANSVPDSLICVNNASKVALNVGKKSSVELVGNAPIVIQSEGYGIGGAYLYGNYSETSELKLTSCTMSVTAVKSVIDRFSTFILNDTQVTSPSGATYVSTGNNPGLAVSSTDKTLITNQTVTFAPLPVRAVNQKIVGEGAVIRDTLRKNVIYFEAIPAPGYEFVSMVSSSAKSYWAGGESGNENSTYISSDTLYAGAGCTVTITFTRPQYQVSVVLPDNTPYATVVGGEGFYQKGDTAIVQIRITDETHELLMWNENIYASAPVDGVYTLEISNISQDYELHPVFGEKVVIITSIEELTTMLHEMETSKVIVNGSLFIIRDGKIYDAAGMMVK